MNNTKQTKKTLALSKQTIRSLSNDELAPVVGGVLEGSDASQKPNPCKTTLPTVG